MQKKVAHDFWYDLRITTGPNLLSRMILNDTFGEDTKGSRNGHFTVMFEHLFRPQFEPGCSAIQNIY
jgi:hypothetical protein